MHVHTQVGDVNYYACCLGSRSKLPNPPAQGNAWTVPAAVEAVQVLGVDAGHANGEIIVVRTRNDRGHTLPMAPVERRIYDIAGVYTLGRPARNAPTVYYRTADDDTRDPPVRGHGRAYPLNRRHLQLHPGVCLPCMRACAFVSIPV